MSEYIRRTWEDGELITAKKLNNMETGIVEAKKEAEGRAPKDSPEFTKSISMGRRAGTVIGNKSVAIGKDVEASGDCSIALGAETVASGEYSRASGTGSEASGYNSEASGASTIASGDHSKSQGAGTKANANYSAALGKFNREMESIGLWTDQNGDAMAVGNGTGDSERSNAFRVSFAGAVYGLSAFNTSGADYAEFFEWLDGNAAAEDRIGFFVTLDGDKIVKAKAGDYILGIVSGNPCIVGNSDEDWLNRWEKDEFGRFIKEEVVTKDEETGETVVGWRYKQNPDYDSSQKYIERKNRQEWDYIGMLGVLAVRDDGTCQVNGFCKVADDGTATAADGYVAGQTYRVIARVTEDVVKVVFR